MSGCPCACHSGREGIFHVMPCHNPLLEPGDPSLPRSVMRIWLDAEPGRKQVNEPQKGERDE